MENKKTLKIKAAVCDVRSAAEETLALYDRVVVDAATLVTSPSAQAVLGRFPVEITAAQTVSTGENVRLSVVNGSLSIGPGQVPGEEKTVLLVNGSLDVAPGSGEALKGYAAITVNGSVAAPESMAGLLSGITVNGALELYPDGCVRLKSRTVLDRTFALRAKQDGTYYARSRVVALDEAVDFEKLAAKNVRFVAKKLLVSEKLAEAAVPLFDERADIEVLPDGCAYLGDDAELNEDLVRRWGGRLYVDGDLTLLEDGPWLDQVSYLKVSGDVLLARGLEERFQALKADYDGLYVVGGTLLSGQPQVRITRGLLEEAENGLSAVACASVTVDGDVPAQLIRDRLVSVAACAKVVCPEALCPVVEPLCREVSKVVSAEEEDGGDGERDPNVVEIRAMSYTL